MRRWSLVGMIAASGFALIALSLHTAPDLLNTADVWASSLAPTDFSVIMVFLAITALGGGVGIIAVAILFAFFARLSSADVFRLAALLSLAAFLNKVFKEFFGRTRPDPLQWFDALPSFSFPSAHATTVCALYGFIAVVLYRRTQSILVALLPILVILLVGMSRIVLGVHHASDIIGGYLLGIALLAFAVIFPFERFVRTREGWRRRSSGKS